MSAHDPTPQQVIKALQDTRALIAQGWWLGRDSTDQRTVLTLIDKTITYVTELHQGG